MTRPPDVQFGLSVHPGTENLQTTLKLARLADEVGLDLLTVMDHPYHRGHLDTWTLLTWLASETNRIRLAPNVANLPLRPPAVLAKMASTLDVLSQGRFELAIGAGGSWDAIAAFGGPRRDSRAAYQAFKEGLMIIREMLGHPGQPVSIQGEHYHVQGAKLGPPPTGRIPIWTGAYGPSMQRLTGRLADGVIVSYSYARPERWQEFNKRLDEGAAQASRSPGEIRRGYNLFGQITADASVNQNGDRLEADAKTWIRKLASWYSIHRVDTFIFWPTGPDLEGQVRSYAHEVAPRVRDQIG